MPGEAGAFLRTETGVNAKEFPWGNGMIVNLGSAVGRRCLPPLPPASARVPTPQSGDRGGQCGYTAGSIRTKIRKADPPKSRSNSPDTPSDWRGYFRFLQ